MCCIRLKLAASEVCGKCDPDQVDESAICLLCDNHIVMVLSITTRPLDP